MLSKKIGSFFASLSSKEKGFLFFYITIGGCAFAAIKHVLDLFFKIGLLKVNADQPAVSFKPLPMSGLITHSFKASTS
jgi:hypothetical protein